MSAEPCNLKIVLLKERQTPLSSEGSHSLQYRMTSNTTQLAQAYQVSMSVTTQVDEVRENCTVYTCSRLTSSIKHSAQVLDTDVDSVRVLWSKLNG